MKDFTGEGLGDPFGHGTAVILTLLYSLYVESNSASRDRSVPEIEVARVIGRRKVSAQEVADRIVQAIDWLAGLHVRIVNISMSLPENAAGYSRLCGTIAEHRDMIFMIAGSNGGPEAVGYPGGCSAANKLVAGAATENGKAAPYSGRADFLVGLPPAPISISEYWRGEGDRLLHLNELAGAREAYEKGRRGLDGAFEPSYRIVELAVLDWRGRHWRFFTLTARQSVQRPHFRSSCSDSRHVLNRAACNGATAINADLVTRKQSIRAPD